MPLASGIHRAETLVEGIFCLGKICVCINTAMFTTGSKKSNFKGFSATMKEN